MLPFPIISNTNILPPRTEIKKIIGVYNSVMYLDSDNNLYGYGNNTSGAMGSISSVNDFTLIDSGVDDVWSTCNYSTATGNPHKAVTVLRKGTNMYWSGLGGLFGNTSYTTTYKTFTDCTSYFSSVGIDVMQIKKISLACTLGNSGATNSGSKCFVLMNNGDLYFMGKALGSSSGLGLAANAVQSTFTLSAQNVLDIDCDIGVSVYIDNDGKALYSGTNLSTGTSNQRSGWGSLSTFTTYKNVMCGYDNAFLFGTSSFVYGVGQTASGNLSTGDTAGGSRYSTLVNITLSDGSTIRSDISSISKSAKSAPRSFVGLLDSVIYSSGVGTYIGYGNDSNYVKLYPIQRPDSAKIKLVASTEFNSWYVSTDNIIYGTGTYLPGSVTSSVYTKIK